MALLGCGSCRRRLRIAALVKQIPAFESMTLGADGRLVREGLALRDERLLPPGGGQGRRAGAADRAARCTVVTLGPPSAEDVLREAIAWGADDGSSVTDPAFAGSDTLATAQALAAARPLDRTAGPVRPGAGRPQLRRRRHRPGAAPAGAAARPARSPPACASSTLADGETVRVVCEHDDEWVDADVDLPAVLSTAPSASATRASSRPTPGPRCRPTASDPHRRRPRAGSVGAGRQPDVGRATCGCSRSSGCGSGSNGPVAEQVAEAVALLADRGVLDPVPDPSRRSPGADRRRGPGRVIGVVVEPDRPPPRPRAAGCGGRRSTLGGGWPGAAGPSPTSLVTGRCIGGRRRCAAWTDRRRPDRRRAAVEEDLAAAVNGGPPRSAVGGAGARHAVGS